MPCFDPVPYLGDELALPYCDPAVLRRLRTTPLKLRGPRFVAQRSEFLQFCKVLDKSDRVDLHPVRSIPPWRLSQFLALWKSQSLDRTLQDRRDPNEEEETPEADSRDMPTGERLCDFHLTGDEVLILSKSDADDCYPSYVATPERAVTNAVGTPVRVREVRDGPGALDPDEWVYVCVRGLPQGDHGAVHYCLDSHRHFLRAEASVLTAESEIRATAPFPRDARSPDALVLDDYIRYIIVSLRALVSGSASRPDRDALERVLSAYDRCSKAGNGLRAAPDKLEVDLLDGTAVGAESLGLLGHMGAPRMRRLEAMLLTVRLLRGGASTRKIIQVLAGIWISIFLFRRPLMNILADIFEVLGGR